MAVVAAALLPAIALGSWQFGPVIWLQVALAIACCGGVEWACLTARRQNVRHGMSDLVWLVTGTLLGLSLPPLTSVWLLMLASVIAIACVKHGAGGLGRNRINPAMAGMAIVVLCFYDDLNASPVWGQAWSARISTLDALSLMLGLGNTGSIDTMVGATPLASAAWLKDGGLMWLAYLAGGLFLVGLRVARRTIPIGIILGMCLGGVLCGESLFASVHALTLGGTMLAAFFIATDPVTSPVSRGGRLIFGVLIGLMTVWIREHGLYRDGLCFAILTANLASTGCDRVASVIRLFLLARLGRPLAHRDARSPR
ncbi:RnfABCDGE type electron transport complex subunit D [Chitinibacteraceae bacterium HSL-7]